MLLRDSDRLRQTLGYASSSPPKLPTSPPEQSLSSLSPGTPRKTCSRPPDNRSPSSSPEIPLTQLRARRQCLTLRSPQSPGRPHTDNAAPSSAKRKAAAPLKPESPSKRPKQDSQTPDEAPPQAKKLIPFPEKPAVIEEREGDIEFRVVNNDGKRESTIVLTGLKCIFQKQLPKMPKDYIARLVYDRTHLSLAIVKKPLEVVGYVGNSS